MLGAGSERPKLLRAALTPWVSAHLARPWRSHRGLLPGLGPQDAAGVGQEGAVGLMGQKPWQQEGGLAVLTWSLMTSAHGVLGGSHDPHPRNTPT